MKPASIQISLVQLRNLLEVAEIAKGGNSSLSDTVSIQVIEPTDTHTGTDKLRFELLCSYAECDGQFLGTN